MTDPHDASGAAEGNVPTTERRLAAAADLDRLSTPDLVRLMNAEDARVAAAVATQEAAIARAIDLIAERLRAGGRLVYAGAGTSGRLGVLDASECPPTFSSPPGQVIGLIAGGSDALTRAIEGAEDDAAAAPRDLDAIGLSAADVLVGIAASGSTPWVLAAVEHARRKGAATIGLACVADAPLGAAVDIAIEPVVGPEVVSGSTRLKAGTATKLVLNQLSTGAMVRLGKTYGDLMVDLLASNAKLRRRAVRICRAATDRSEDDARRALDAAGGDLKVAIVTARRGIAPSAAAALLARTGGDLRQALEGSTDDR